MKQYDWDMHVMYYGHAKLVLCLFTDLKISLPIQSCVVFIDNAMSTQ